MRIWLISDLHIELTRGWDLPRSAQQRAFDVLVVAGDLITRMERGVAWLRERVTNRHVVYIAGNAADRDRPYGEGLPFFMQRVDVMPIELTRLKRPVSAYLRDNLHYTFAGFNFPPTAASSRCSWKRR
jgi:predicted phosphodiesterase